MLKQDDRIQKKIEELSDTYEFIEEKGRPVPIWRIRANRDLPAYGVRKGDVGGTIAESELLVLSSTNPIWLEFDCAILKDAVATGYVHLKNGAELAGSAVVHGGKVPDSENEDLNPISISGVIVYGNCSIIGDDIDIEFDPNDSNQGLSGGEIGSGARIYSENDFAFLTLPYSLFFSSGHGQYTFYFDKDNDISVNCDGMETHKAKDLVRRFNDTASFPDLNVELIDIETGDTRPRFDKISNKGSSTFINLSILIGATMDEMGLPPDIQPSILLYADPQTSNSVTVSIVMDIPRELRYSSSNRIEFHDDGSYSIIDGMDPHPITRDLLEDYGVRGHFELGWYNDGVMDFNALDKDFQNSLIFKCASILGIEHKIKLDTIESHIANTER